jgi:hypothetical protein
MKKNFSLKREKHFITKIKIYLCEVHVHFPAVASQLSIAVVRQLSAWQGSSKYWNYSFTFFLLLNNFK